MELDTELQIGAQVISREVGGETVLLDLASGVYFGIDEVGTRIWAALTAGQTLRQIADALVAEYEVDRATAERDVIAFAEKLEESGLVSRS